MTTIPSISGQITPSISCHFGAPVTLGDWLHLVALFALVAFKWHADPIAMAGITLCMVLPSILFGSPAGWLADRFNRKVLMSFSDFARCGCVLGIAFSVSLWQVYIFLFFLGFFSAVFTPAESGLLRQVVGENQIQAAIGTSEMINNSAKIIGPVAGGALISLTGIKGAFYLDAISFFLSALLLFGIKAPTLQSPVKSDLEHREKVALTEGFRFLSGFPVLKMGLIVFCTMILALQISDSQAMILIRDIKNATVHFASWCIAASGFGMLTASVLFTKIKLGEKLITLKISPAILGLGCIIVSTGTGWPIGIIEAVYPCVFFLMGFSFTMAAIPFDVLVQKKTPETHTGRVFGTINSLSTLAVLVGILLGGSLSEWFGVRLAFLISGGTTCLLAAVSAIAMKKAERKEIHVAEGIKTTS